MSSDCDSVKWGFCVFLDTVCQGSIPIEHNGYGAPIVYASREEAQMSINEDRAERELLRSMGEWAENEAVTKDEYVQAVVVDGRGRVHASESYR